MSQATRVALERIARPLARQSALGWAALGAGIALALLGLVAWLARVGLARAPLWVPAAWILVVAATAFVLLRAGRDRQRLSTTSIAQWLEQGGRWRRGGLGGLLDAAGRGTSPALLAMADEQEAQRLAHEGRAALAPMALPIRHRSLGGAACLVAGIALLGSARPWTAPASRVWHPARALVDASQPVRLRASAESVMRGADITLTVVAPGRATATLYTRAPGETWQAEEVALDSSGMGVVRPPPLTADLFARASSGNRESDTVHVTVRLPAFLGSLTVTARYPAYLHMADEPLPVSGDTILLPAGTRLRTIGEATAPLEAAAWRGAGPAESLSVSGTHFSGEFVPASTGMYRLDLSVEGKIPLGGDTVRLPLRLVPDSAPSVSVPVPGVDTVAPLSMRLPLVVEARDDHGLTRVHVESRRPGSAVRMDTLALGTGQPDRAILAYQLDLSLLGTRPGDTVRYRVIATDNAPAHHTGMSREFLVRVPTAGELRDAAREASTDLSRRLDSLARRGQDVARQTEDLSRERARAESSSRNGTDPPLSFEQAKRAQAAADATQQLVQQSEQLKDALDALRQAAEQAGLDDPEFQQRLAEVREQLAKALTPELRARLAQLQQALKNLDADEARRALEELADAQKQLKDALERSRELFQRAALEGELAALADQARELAKAQEKWNEQAMSADSAQATAGERDLSRQADSLAASLKAAAAQLDSSPSQGQLEQSSDQAAQAARQMQQAAQRMQAGDRSGARQHGAQAQQMLAPLGGQMDQARKQMQSGWRDEVTRALDQALAETSQLSARELALSGRLEAGGAAADARRDQAMVEDGLERVAARMRDIAGKNALVSQQIGVALEVARSHMASARDAVSSANPNMQAASDRAGSAVDALNAAAYMMVRSRNDVAGAASGSGLGEAMEQMSKLAGQQGQIGQQTASMLPQAGQGQAGMQQQLLQLGAQQRAIAEQLERMRAEGNMPGSGQLASEAQELARRLEAGRLDRQTVERQQQLFHRMLDAGRTLQGQETDEKKERQSTTARDGEISLPPALREQLGREGRIRLPSWDELQQLSPEDRRLVVDYFRRLSEDAPQ